jgi:hypothetical protein
VIGPCNDGFTTEVCEAVLDMVAVKTDWIELEFRGDGSLTQSIPLFEALANLPLLSILAFLEVVIPSDFLSHLSPSSSLTIIYCELDNVLAAAPLVNPRTLPSNLTELSLYHLLSAVDFQQLLKIPSKLSRLQCRLISTSDFDSWNDQLCTLLLSSLASSSLSQFNVISAFPSLTSASQDLFDQLLKRNSTLLRCSFFSDNAPTSRCWSDFALAHRNFAYRRRWIAVAILLSFYRANSNSSLCSSIIPLIKRIILPMDDLAFKNVRFPDLDYLTVL